MTNQHVRDWYSILGSLADGPSEPAVVSYAIHWHGVRRRRHVRNETLHVAGLFLDTHATIEWTGHDATSGFTFTANAAGQSVVSAQIGHERNGVFFD